MQLPDPDRSPADSHGTTVPVPPRPYGALIRGTLWAVVWLAVGAIPAAAQDTGTLAGVVLDADNGQPVADVEISVAGTTLQAVSNQEGRFLLLEVPVGEWRLVFTHLAYGAHARSLTFEADATTEYQVRMSRQAIELSPVVVEVRTPREQAQRASGTSRNEVTSVEIAEAARRGVRLTEVLRFQMPGIRWSRIGGEDCVEYRNQMGRALPGGCRHMAVYLDGAPVSDPGLIYQSLSLDDIERMEVLSPAEAGAQYGGQAGAGVLLIETKGGLVSNRPFEDTTISVFDWSLDEEGHPWLRVLGMSFVANAATIGLNLLSMHQCTGVMSGSLELRSGCHQAVGAGVGVLALALPGTVTGLAARRAGSTELSRGLLHWSIAMGTITTWTGYLMFFNGRANDSSVGEGLGLGMLLVGTPLVVSLSDRVFRALR